MATITTTNFAPFLPRADGFVPTSSIFGVQSSSVHGRPVMITTRGRVRCTLEEIEPLVYSSGSSSTNKVGGASLTAAVAAVVTAAGPAVALVDERMSTEGTGLPFGLSNNLLGWILLGVFALIWALYFIYTTDLDEDDDSGLSL